jgi:hypothetical protein
MNICDFYDLHFGKKWKMNESFNSNICDSYAKKEQLLIEMLQKYNVTLGIYEFVDESKKVVKSSKRFNNVVTTTMGIPVLYEKEKDVYRLIVSPTIESILPYNDKNNYINSNNISCSTYSLYY